MTVKITYTIEPDDHTEKEIKNDIEQELSCCVLCPGDDLKIELIKDETE